MTELIGRFLTELEQRQQFRREVGLPPLDRAHELERLRRLIEERRRAAFDAWEPELRRRVEDKLLARCRRRRSDPTWVPAGMIKGLDFGLGVEETMLRIWRMRGRRP
jgi:hypothetical protein